MKKWWTGQTSALPVPEIALTTHIIELCGCISRQYSVYHSRFNDNRGRGWQKVWNNEYKVILGARSLSIFAICRSGFIIVDEEHENIIQTVDPAPRYNARDAAYILANVYR